MRAAPPPDAFDEPFFGKATIQVALVLSLIVVLGFFAVSIMLRLHGYGHEDVFTHLQGAKWNPVALFIRHHGFHLLWVPVAWTCCAAVAQRQNRGALYPSTFWIGVMITVAMLITFAFAATNATPRW